jgi:hypothetical protein
MIRPRAGSGVWGLRARGLEEYLTAYLDGADLRGDAKGPLFRTIGRGTGKLTRTVLPQANAYAMIGRRAAAAGIATKLGNHSFRATRITAYLKNGGTLEKAAAMANHASTRTNLSCDLTCPGQEGKILGHPRKRSSGAVSLRTAAQERYPLYHIAILHLDPPATDRSLRMPAGETLLGRHRNQLACPLIQGHVVSAEQKQQGAERQARSQRRRVSQPPSFSDRCPALYQGLVRITETEKVNPQIPQR